MYAWVVGTSLLVWIRYIVWLNIVNSLNFVSSLRQSLSLCFSLSLSLSFSLSLFLPPCFVLYSGHKMSAKRISCASQLLYQPCNDADGRYQTATFPRTKIVSESLSKQHQSGRSTQTLSLISFLKKYSSSLPIRVRVVEGYSGKNDRYISDVYVYTCHIYVSGPHAVERDLLHNIYLVGME